MKRANRWTAAAAVFLFALAAPRAGAQPEKLERITAIEGITEYRLGNGLVVLLFPDRTRPTVTVNITIFVGSRHEGYGETGMAHLLEHMLFKGTPTHPDIDKLMDARGAQINGSTWVDRTNYFETLPAGDDNLEFAIRLEADRLVNSFVRKEDLDSEMTVVRNEFEAGENDPRNVLEQRILAVAYEWHNYGKSTIGNKSDIELVPIESLRRFYRKYYRPDNAMLVVAGQFDEAKALAYIQKHFGALSRPTAPIEKTYTQEPPQDGERLVVLRRVGEVGHVGVAYHIPAGSHPEFAAIESLEDILTSRPAGLLYQALVETKKATEVAGAAYAWHDPAVLLVTAAVRKGQDLQEVRDLMLKTIEDVGLKGVSTEQVERARQRFLKQRELAAADSTRIAIELSEWAAQGDWRLYFLHRDRIEKVTPEDVRRVAAAYLKPTNRTVGLYIPTDQPTRVAVPPPPNIAALLKDYKGRAAMSAGEEFDPTPKNIDARTQRHDLAKGVRIALFPKKTRGETVLVSIKLRYGNAENLKGLTSACGILPELMTRATKRLSRQQLQDALDAARTNLQASGAVGEANFNLRTQRAYLAKVLDLLRQILREPTLPSEELEIIRRQRLAQLESMSKEPQGRAFNLIQRSLSPYPAEDVRYVPTIEESIARVQQVSRDQVEKLYRAYLGDHAAEVVVIGDFDPSATLAALRETLGNWRADRDYARIERPAVRDVHAGRTLSVTPDKANAVYAAGCVFPMKDDHPDFAALLIVNHILGGTFSSRLTTRIRQKEGLSYGVGSRIVADAVDHRATAMFFAICNPVNMPKVELAMREELERMIREGISTDELDHAKGSFLKEQRIGLGRDPVLSGILQENLHAGRTMTYYVELERQIESLTPESVHAAVRKHIAPDKLVIVVAGDFAKDTPSSGKPPATQ
jgi:zinc protease